ncbi:MAG: L-2-hydroxyglutarate oxidase [Bacteroidetes bacterium]|nr:L-2-hydroxyglutarate oxidase [Bacteroidota bacterium]
MKYDVIIIGAGIVGLASALKLQEAKPGLKLLIIEKENDICKHQTGNNSGVIHSGIYYKPGSLKALNCSRGYKLLLDFCDKNNVKYEICGKVIVATNSNELLYLHNIYKRGLENGLKDLKLLEKEEVAEIEPHVNGIKGIRVPQTGIINYLEVAKAIEKIVMKFNAEIVFNEEVLSINLNSGSSDVVTNKNSYSAKQIVSCAGLHSDRIAKMTDKNLPLRIIPFRGEYYKLKDKKRHLVNSLIYPVPDPSFPFLGVHFTRMINGEVEAGPNAVLAFKREGYNKYSFNAKDSFETLSWPGFVNVAKKYWKTGLGEYHRSFSKKAFVKALQKLIPEISEDDLVPGGAGVRAQACDIKGGLLDDFYFVENKNVVHVCNAPSPAATSSLAIGETVANKLLSRLIV